MEYALCIGPALTVVSSFEDDLGCGVALDLRKMESYAFAHPGKLGFFSAQEAPMPRKYIDCREFPSEKNCSLAISGTEEEVLDLAVLHAVNAHGHQNTPELRGQLRSLLKDDRRQTQPRPESVKL
mgnify:FL=1